MSLDDADDYQEWREKHKQTHQVISDLEEKRRTLSEQVKIKKLQDHITSLENTLQNFQNSDKNITKLSQLEREVLKILYETNEPMDRIEVWNQIKIGDPMTFVNFTRLEKMGFIRRSGYTKWTHL